MVRQPDVLEAPWALRYRRAALERFAALPPSELERSERLEQLRLLENGISIYVAETRMTRSALTLRMTAARGSHPAQTRLSNSLSSQGIR